ncbi:hypothetical protein Bca52824_002520 [Brassica carinata]|uniref:DUF1985 domain-containing protein n=1 Tax=Brassica carinata TaxID=52824 RepID=A0A8X7WLB7_BRACI|nr:hypothetical protein Bca52824_002520 [Brassica carinata]
MQKLKPDNRLPQRLFATDRYPCNRLNIYSKPDYIAFIRHVLRGTEEFETIKASCFGKLFDLPSRQCPVSCKLIHSMLTRQLVCADKHTLWPVFAGHPFRFGLQEFGTITGLPCGAFPPGYNPDMKCKSDPRKDAFWVRLIGKKRFTTIEDLRHQLATDRNMTSWRRLRLALIIIVDGVLIVHEQKPRPTLRFVKLVEHLELPEDDHLHETPQICKKTRTTPTQVLVDELKQESYRLQGFPLALQLVAFSAVPKLLSIIQAPFDSLTIMDLDVDHLPIYPSIATQDIHGVEADPKLAVTALIPVERQPQPGWGVWPDVCDDDRTEYMEQRIADRQPFTKAMWPGGDASEPFITFPTIVELPVSRKRSTRSRKTNG